MEINKLLSSSKNYTSATRSVSNIKYIAVHYTGNSTDTAKANCNYFKENYVGASAHYFVDETSIWQSVPDDHTAWSVGKNYGSNNMFGTVTNSNSISIELCSNNRVITSKTQQNAAWLIKELMKKYNIPVSRVVRHYDVCSKLCPGWDGWYGKNAPRWDAFKELLEEPAKTTQTSEKKYYVTTANLNMRNGAGTSYDIITTIKSGSKVTYLDKSKTVNGTVWRYCQKTVGGVKYKGWMSSKYLKKYEG